MNWDDPAARLALVERVGTEEYNRLMRAHQAASAVETVNGHAIRPVASRFGRIFLVGNTGTGFSTLDDARKHARTLPA